MGECGCSLLPSFIHLVEKFVIWTHFSTFGHICFSWFITAPRIPLAPLALFVLSITHTHHETTPKWLDHNKTWLVPQSTASLEFLLPLWDTQHPHLPQASQGSTAGGPNLPHLKGMKKQHLVLRGAPGEAGLCQVLFLCSAKAPAGK